MKQQTLLRGRRGVMLIDAMIGVMMLALVAMIFAAALNGAALSRGMADGQTKAVIILGRQMESIRNVGYANLNYTSLLYYGLIDGSSTTSPYSFTNAGQVISDQVSNILKDGAGTVQITDVTDTIRQVTVTVSWSSHTGTRSVSATTQLASLD